MNPITPPVSPVTPPTPPNNNEDDNINQLIDYTIDEFNQFLRSLTPTQRTYALQFFNWNSNFILNYVPID